MRHKSLPEEQLRQFRAMALEGVSPADMADYFKISVSAVHVYKTRLREAGLDLPDLKGKRPAGFFAKELPVITRPEPKPRRVPRKPLSQALKKRISRAESVVQVREEEHAGQAYEVVRVGTVTLRLSKELLASVHVAGRTVTIS